MEDGQGGDGDDDHGALEDHERDLVVGKGAVEAAAELCTAEDGADEDGEGGDDQSYRKADRLAEQGDDVL